MVVQPAPELSQSLHAYAYEGAGVPDHVPFVVLSVCPWRASPDTVGAAELLGGTGVGGVPPPLT
jgi:hypothetical protein